MSISKKEIHNSLLTLDGLHLRSPEYSEYFSKLALLELCGWVEYSMDEIVKDFTNKRLKGDAYRKIFKEKVVKVNNGFLLRDHFFTMLYRTIGICKAEAIETKMVVSGYYDALDAALSILHEHRNDAAHLHIAKKEKPYNTPAKMIGYLDDTLYPVLKFIQKEVNKLR